MTTPNAFTRTSLVDIAASTTTSLTELERVMPHMRAVTNSATGHRAALMRRALAEADLLEQRLREADVHAEAVKTLFRSATTGSGPAPYDQESGAAAAVRRQA